MLDRMQVTAGIAGILQELTVDIGSSVSAGEKNSLDGVWQRSGRKVTGSSI